MKKDIFKIIKMFLNLFKKKERKSKNDIKVCLHCGFHKGTDAKIYCKLNQKSHDVLKICKDFMDMDNLHIDDYEIKAIAENMRIDRRTKKAEKISYISLTIAIIMSIVSLFSTFRNIKLSNLALELQTEPAVDIFVIDNDVDDYLVINNNGIFPIKNVSISLEKYVYSVKDTGELYSRIAELSDQNSGKGLLNSEIKPKQRFITPLKSLYEWFEKNNIVFNQLKEKEYFVVIKLIFFRDVDFKQYYKEKKYLINKRLMEDGKSNYDYLDINYFLKLAPEGWSVTSKKILEKYLKE